ncbi:unnamed protein product [Phytomonas sp. Hart1]|nr:unnamed protein product [Phytomonas sp. Hart1]|eukprot:CCW69502.1 unnamed protein product [Phytomonas sp. isolate Hart1]
MTSSLSAFDPLRTPFVGPNDVIKCIEVDITGDRVYAATWGNGVYVWELFKRRQLALMYHPDWVNAVRCYPPLSNTSKMNNKSEEQYTSVLEYLQAKDLNELTSEGEGVKKPLYAQDVLCAPAVTTEWVLTGCEDGVISAWCPVTFRIRSQCKPTENPITQLILAKGPRSTTLVPSSSFYDNNVNKTNKKMNLKEMPGAPFLCYALSLDNVFVIHVQSGLQCIHKLSHPEYCTAVEILTTPSMRCLLVGQESGSIKCWTLSGDNFEYKETLHYPAGEVDIDEDAEKSNEIHAPQMVNMRNILTNTFSYNLRRSTDRSDPGIRLSLDEQRSRYEMHIPASMPWDDMRKGSYTLTRERVLSSELSEDHLTYDQRRVTCLLVPKRGSALNCRFFSGHATGEVLVWQSIFENQPILLVKKIKLFDSPKRWVWNMQTIEVSVSSAWLVEELSANKESKNDIFLPINYLQEGNSKNVEVFFYQLVVWADNGQIVYLQVGKDIHKTDGPGFMATASYSYSIENASKDPPNEMETQSTLKAKNKVSKTVRRLPPLAPGKGNSSMKKCITGQYFIIMGNAEGRLEQFNISNVVTKLLHASIKS